MKTNAIIRIAIYSFVIVLLVCLLCNCLGIGRLVFDLGFGSGSYITGEGSVQADKIQNLEINWVSGDIHIEIEPAGSNQITFTESGNAGEEYAMVWEQKGTTLVIQFSKPAVQIGFMSTPAKDLTVTFPADWVCGNLKVVTVSGSVKVTGLNAQEMEIESISSPCEFSLCTVTEVSVNTVSGNIQYTGDVEEFSCESVSADCSVFLSNNAKKISLDGVSGDLTVSLFENMGFSASIDSLSGNIYSDFSTSITNGRQVYGDGSCIIEADTLSGDINIREARLELTAG